VTDILLSRSFKSAVTCNDSLKVPIFLKHEQSRRLTTNFKKTKQDELMID